MSTRGCIIELKKDICKVGYLHYGANFASKYKNKLTTESCSHLHKILDSVESFRPKRP